MFEKKPICCRKRLPTWYPCSDDNIRLWLLHIGIVNIGYLMGFDRINTFMCIWMSISQIICVRFIIIRFQTSLHRVLTGRAVITLLCFIEAALSERCIVPCIMDNISSSIKTQPSLLSQSIGCDWIHVNLVLFNTDSIHQHTTLSSIFSNDKQHFHSIWVIIPCRRGSFHLALTARLAVNSCFTLSISVIA